MFRFGIEADFPGTEEKKKAEQVGCCLDIQWKVFSHTDVSFWIALRSDSGYSENIRELNIPLESSPILVDGG
jgi:hypothetical protein